jgi:hypothetical protein
MLGLAALAVLATLLVQRAKSYYAGPVYPLLLAAASACRLTPGRPFAIS